MKTKAELIAECSELAEKHNLELPQGLKGLNYPAVEELLVKLQAQVAALPAPGTPAAVEGAAPAAPSADAPAASETPPVDTSTPAVDGAAGAGEQPPPPPEQPPPPAAGASEQAPAPPPPLKLPPGHKRPTVKEFVKAGYKAEDYEAHMAEREAEVAAKFANVPRYVVAPGRSLCGARGMLGPGAPVREDDFTGESKLEDFVRAGYVVAEA